MKQFKKICPIIGIVLGLVMALCGILVMQGELGGDTFYANTALPSYDTGYATFGADFYNYVSNNTAEAADAAQAAVQNLRAQNELLKNAMGLAMIWFGLMASCFFGMHLETPEPPVQPDELPGL